MNLFTAFDYEGLENRTTAMLVAVLANLTPEARDAVLVGVVPNGLGHLSEVQVQRGVGGGVLDGWLRWGGEGVALALEAKVDSPLGRKQIEQYAEWLCDRSEQEKIVWVVTRNLDAARQEVASAVCPVGVRTIWTSWDEIARRCEEMTASNSLDGRLVEQLAQRLRSLGIAARRIEALNDGALQQALRGLHQVKALRETLLVWFQGCRPWLPGEWKIEARCASWTEMSVCGERWLKFGQADPSGKHPWVSWWFEAWVPASGGQVVWPVGATQGMGARLGLHISGRDAADVALEQLRRALGAPGVDGSIAATEWHPWVYDRGNYHEVWWLIPCDPFDLPAFEATLKRAVDEQAERLAPLFGGTLATRDR
jgi:hypothetical protein